MFLLEGNEARGMGSTNTGSSMLDGFIRDGELSKIVANHLRFDLNLIESLAIVNSDDASNHLGNDDHVPQVGPYWFRLLTSRSLPFRLAQLLDQSHRLSLQASLKPSASAGAEELDELVGGHVEERVEVDALEAELLERPLLRLPRRNFYLHVRHVRCREPRSSEQAGGGAADCGEIS